MKKKKFLFRCLYITLLVFLSGCIESGRDTNSPWFIVGAVLLLLISIVQMIFLLRNTRTNEKNEQTSFTQAVNESAALLT